MSLSLAIDNIEFVWKGFNDSLKVFVSETMSRAHKMRDADLREVFEQVKEKLLQKWKNYYLQQTFRLAYQELNTVLIDNNFTQKQLRAILENFTYEEFQKMQAQWLKSGRMLWFVHGNLSKDDAIAIVDGARSTFKITPIPKEEFCSVRCIDLH